MLQGKKTYIGIGIAAVAVLSQVIGVEVTEAETQKLITSVTELVGLAVAIYGRMTVTK